MEGFQSQAWLTGFMSCWQWQTIGYFWIGDTDTFLLLTIIHCTHTKCQKLNTCPLHMWPYFTSTLILQEENPLFKWHLLTWNHTSFLARILKNTGTCRNQPFNLTQCTWTMVVGMWPFHSTRVKSWGRSSSFSICLSVSWERHHARSK